MHNIRSRVRGATHLQRSRRAENWDIMTVKVKGEGGVMVGWGVEAKSPPRGNGEAGHHFANASRLDPLTARRLSTSAPQPARPSPNLPRNPCPHGLFGLSELKGAIQTLPVLPTF
jgi:hypothetical protein